jgi:hypothetical protein
MNWSRRHITAATGAMAALLAVSACSSQEPVDPTEEVITPAAADSMDIKVGREANAPFLVTAEDLGIHSYTTQPEIPAKSIAINCSPNWASDNPKPGEFNWTGTDEIVERAELWGFTNILMVFCVTPEWAGKPVEGDDPSVVGPGGAQPPKKMSDWRTFVEAVVKRYRGRVSGYSVWNEPSTKQFFNGTPKQMAQMTAVLYETVGKISPETYVMSGGIQTHTEAYRGFLEQYLSQLAKLDWPIDGLSVHLYPPAGGTPQTRVERIEWLQQVLADQEMPTDRPIWDTEVNYDVSQPGGEPDGRISGQRAAAWTVASYLDGWRTGVRRTFWYIWSPTYYGFPGIQMRPGDPSTLGLTTFANWVIGAEFRGCEVADRLIDCSFNKDGEFRVAYSTSGNVELTLDGPAEICPVYGGDCTQSATSVRINDTPVRIVQGDG